MTNDEILRINDAIRVLKDFCEHRGPGRCTGRCPLEKCGVCDEWAACAVFEWRTLEAMGITEEGME